MFRLLLSDAFRCWLLFYNIEQAKFTKVSRNWSIQRQVGNNNNNNNKGQKRRPVRFKTFGIDEHVIMRIYLTAQNVPHSLSNFPEKVSLVVGSLVVLDSSIKKKKSTLLCQFFKQNSKDRAVSRNLAKLSHRELPIKLGEIQKATYNRKGIFKLDRKYKRRHRGLNEEDSNGLHLGFMKTIQPNSSSTFVFVTYSFDK